MTDSQRELLKEALEFYADPFTWKKKHDPEDVVRVPDFYSETSFGDTAVEALAAPAAVGMDARGVLEEIATLAPETDANKACGCTVCEARRIAQSALSSIPQPPSLVVPAGVVREALTLGRDAVMESFEYVENKDDQMLADMRLQSIDAAIATLSRPERGGPNA